MKVSCVDDDPCVLVNVKAVLTKNHDVVTANSREDCLETFLTQGSFPFVLSDIQMPDLSRLEVLKKIHEESPPTVSMLQAGQAGFSISKEALEKGHILQVLLKPIAITDLRDAMKLCVETGETRQVRT